MVRVIEATAPLDAVYPAGTCKPNAKSIMIVCSRVEQLTQTLHTDVGYHGSEVHDPAAHIIGVWRLCLELTNGIFAAKENASCVDTHVGVKHLFVDLIDG